MTRGRSKPPDERTRDDAVETDDGERTTAGEQDPPVVVEGLRKVYGSGDDAVTAIDGVSFEIESGSAVGVLGPNGAGKTTTIKSILGLILPTEGDVQVAGIDVHDDPGTAYRYMGSMLEGARNIYWRLTVQENLRFFASLAGQDPDEVADRHEELLAQFDLEGKADAEVRELSRGMQQKVALASTLARDVEVLFLDEPTLGVDIESAQGLRRELRRLVEDDGKTVMVSSHDMDVIEDVCDRVIIMNEGRIVTDDTVENLLGLFRTQNYEVTVEETLPDGTRERLRERFGADGFDRQDGTERFEVSVAGDEFYAVANVLQEAGATVDTFDAIEADLEEVFLQATDETDAPGDGGTVADAGGDGS